MKGWIGRTLPFQPGFKFLLPTGFDDPRLGFNLLWIGNNNENVVPSPARLIKWILAFICSAAQYTAVIPNPEDCADFVVKKGSNICVWTDSIMPRPVSLMVSPEYSPGSAQPFTTSRRFSIGMLRLVTRPLRRRASLRKH